MGPCSPNATLRAARLALLLTGSLPGVACAQAGQDLDRNDEIVVTAQKRAERLQEVPAPVSVLSGEAIDRMGVTNLRDFATSVPGVTIVPIENSTTKIVIRGVSTGNNFEATTSATGMYLDDVPLGSSFGSGGTELATVDLQRIEVLRGPQGTLYGAGSAGGTVKYITNLPDPTGVSGSLAVSGALTDGAGTVAAEGVLNLPLAQDRLALRIVGTYRNAEGWIDNVNTGKRGVNYAESAGVRGSLLWNATDRLTVSLMGVHQKSDLGVSSWTDMSTGLEPLAGYRKQSLSIRDEPAYIRSRLGNLKIDYEFDWATLTSATSWTDFHRGEVIDDTFYTLGRLTRMFVPGTVALTEEFETRDRAFYQEVRLASPAGATDLTWVAGAFYRNYRLFAARPLRPDPYPGFMALDLVSNQKFQDLAAFGQATYRFLPRWELTLGGRYTHATNFYAQSLAGLFINPAAPTVPIVSPERKASSSHFSPRAELTFRPAAGALLYALVSEGFRAGGPNVQYPAPLPNGPATYSADNVWNYEAGAKTSWLGDRLVVNLSAFWADIDKLQVVTVNAAGLPTISNGDRARSRGIELEVRARPARGLRLGGTLTYTEAAFTSPAPALGIAQAGTPIPLVPKWSWTATGDYDFAIARDVQGFLHLDYRHVGRNLTLLPNATSPAVYLPAYDLMNMRVGASRGNTDISLFVQNVWNERALFQAVRIEGVTPPGLRVVTAAPTTFGVKLAQRF